MNDSFGFVDVLYFVTNFKLLYFTRVLKYIDFKIDLNITLIIIIKK